ncbi:MAG TPA: helix-turn-helix transcriptional regulator [Phycisphaerae bacterium]|nr:helix-turn-helix transcriptional regulator [Phycisphaerae bacterium]
MIGRMPPRIYKEIRKAIAKSDKSRYQMSQETGIGQPQLCDFMKGVKGLSVEALEKLAACLDLTLAVKPAKRTRRLKTGRKEG